MLKFLEALQTADHGLLMSALAEDAAITSDGGGKVRAALNVVCGRDRVVRLLLGVRKKYVGVVEDRLMNVNGEFGIVTYVNGEPRALFAFETSEIAILALYRVVNPEKLKSVPTPSARSGKDFRYS